MQPYPHHYRVVAAAGAEGDVSISATGVPDLVTAPPAGFGGPGDRWSPETLLVGAVSDCLILTFRAVARASKLEWTRLECEVEGVLDRSDGVTRFTEFRVRARLAVPDGTDPDKARRLLEKAEKGCLVTNSLRAESKLLAEVQVG
jgi:organic hydroperoxide reductase OsmC/OhrA